MRSLTSCDVCTCDTITTIKIIYTLPLKVFSDPLTTPLSCFSHPHPQAGIFLVTADSIFYKWNHTVCTILSDPFIQHKCFEIHPSIVGSSIVHSFLVLLFHCMNTQQNTTFKAKVELAEYQFVEYATIHLLLDIGLFAVTITIKLL